MEGVKTDWMWGAVRAQEHSSNFQILSFSVWSLVIVFIEAEKMGEKQMSERQSSVQCVKFKNVKCEYPVRHPMQMSW